ncbi:reverse transcriptase [Tanacetum coccineum]
MLKEKEQLQKTLDSWKDSSKNLWRLINSGMSSNNKLGLRYEIQLNNEVLSYEEEMNFSVFNCLKEDLVGKPLYSRFTKTSDFKGVPHPLSGDYTPIPQEEIDESLYVYGKKGPQEPEPSVSDDRSKVYVSLPITTTEKGVSAPKSKEVEPSCVLHIKTPRQPIKDQVTPKVNRKNWNDMMERELGEGYSFTKKKFFVCGSLSHLIKDCDYYEKKMAREAEFKKQRVFNTGNEVAKPVWTNANRVNHANQFVPRSVQLNDWLAKLINYCRLILISGVNVNSVRPNVNTGRVNVNSVKSNVNTGRKNVNPVRPRVNTGSSNVNYLLDSRLPGNWGSAIKIARKRKKPQPDVDSDDEHKKCLKIVTFEGTIDSEIMERKSVIARLNKVSSPDGDYLVIYRANGNFRAFNYLLEVLHIFDKQDLFHLYDLVMKQYSKVTLEGIELILWGYLKIIMESSTEENDQKLEDGTVIHMLVERRYPLFNDLLQRMLDFGLEVEIESTTALDLIRVFNSPCFMVKSWLVQDQTGLGKDYSNLLIADSLLKLYGLSMHHVMAMKHWLVQKQTVFGKDKSIPLMVDSLPKTETMITVNQGMSVEEIEQLVAQRVANVIEAIAIYKTKTNMACKSMSQTERQEDKVATRESGKVTKMEAPANKIKGIRCLERTLLGQSARKHMLDLYLCATSANFTIMDRALHYKSECPIVKFHKRIDMIHGRVRESKPKIMQDAIEFVTKLMDKKISTPAERQAKNKRKLDNTSKNNQNQQQPNKRQNTGRAYIAGHEEKKQYGGSKPLCSKCNYHHDGPCAPKCHKYNRVGHLARDCRSSINANTANNQRGTGASQKATCYECRNQGHYMNDCPEQKNQNHENRTGGTGARGVVHAFGGGETEQDLNNIEDEIDA